MSATDYTISEKTCVVRGTDRNKGRTSAVAPGLTATRYRYLHYGRIILQPDDEAIRFEIGTHETGLIG